VPSGCEICAAELKTRISIAGHAFDRPIDHIERIVPRKTMWWEGCGVMFCTTMDCRRYPSRKLCTEILRGFGGPDRRRFTAFQRGLERPSVLETGLKVAW